MKTRLLAGLTLLAAFAASAEKLAFPGKGYELVLDQFMMGDDLLVAPVVEGGAKTRTVVIPEGAWRSDRGETVVGPKAVTVETPIDRLPYFERMQER